MLVRMHLNLYTIHCYLPEWLMQSIVGIHQICPIEKHGIMVS
jgi:hypothetical protein